MDNEIITSELNTPVLNEVSTESIQDDNAISSTDSLILEKEDLNKLKDLVKVVHSQYLHKDYFENKLLSIYEKELGYKKIANLSSISFLLFSISIQAILLLFVFNVAKGLVLPDSMLYYGLPAIKKSIPEIADGQNFQEILDEHKKGTFASFSSLSTILANISTAINNNLELNHLCLEGISGIGKTSFMQTLIHYLLETAQQKNFKLGYIQLTSDHFINVPNKSKQLLRYFKQCERLLEKKAYERIIVSLDEIDEYIDPGFDMTSLEIRGLTFYTTSNNRPKNSAQMASRMNIIRFDTPLPAYFNSVMNSLFKNNGLKLGSNDLQIKEVTTLKNYALDGSTQTYDLFNLIVMTQSDMRPARNIDKFTNFCTAMNIGINEPEQNNLRVKTIENIIRDQIQIIKASIISKQKIISQFENTSTIKKYVSNNALLMEKIKTLFTSNINIQEQTANIDKQMNLIVYDIQRLSFFQLLMSEEFTMDGNKVDLNTFLIDLNQKRKIINSISAGLAHKILDIKGNDTTLDTVTPANILNTEFAFPTEANTRKTIFTRYGDLYKAIIEIESSEYAAELSTAILQALKIKTI